MKIKQKNLLRLVALLQCAGVASASLGAELTIHLDEPGAEVSPTHYGIFFEDINRAGDGGLYAELLQNRSFEDNEHLIAWTPFMDSRAKATFELDRSSPLHENNPTSLKIHIDKTGGERVAVYNQGFKGIVSPKKAPETSEEWRKLDLSASFSRQSRAKYSKERFCTSSAYNPPSAA